MLTKAQVLSVQVANVVFIVTFAVLMFTGVLPAVYGFTAACVSQCVSTAVLYGAIPHLKEKVK